DRIEPCQVALVRAATAHTEERRANRLDRVDEVRLLFSRLLRHLLPRFHHPPCPGNGPRACCAAGCAAAALPATSKNVYDSVIVPTSFGSFGSTTKTTGKRRVSLPRSSCCSKQKHSTLRKYAADCCGA